MLVFLFIKLLYLVLTPAEVAAQIGVCYNQHIAIADTAQRGTLQLWCDI